MVRYLEALFSVLGLYETLIVMLMAVLASAMLIWRRRGRIDGPRWRRTCWLPLGSSLIIATYVMIMTFRLDSLMRRGQAISDEQREVLMNDAYYGVAKIVTTGIITTAVLVMILRVDKWRQHSRGT